MAKDQRWKKKKPPEWGRLSIMALVGLLGIIAIFIAGKIGEPFWKSGVEHLGTAIFIAAILGFTIHIWLERQLTEDVFSAAMGYELPDELKEEIRFVYGNRILCEDHSQSMQIEDLKNGFVRVIIGTERMLRNIAQTEQELNISLGIDEWHVKGHPSAFLEIDYKFENKEKITIFPGGDVEIFFRPEGSLARVKSSIKLASKQTVTVFTKCSETKPINGEHFFHYAYATLNPRVRIQLVCWICSQRRATSGALFRYGNLRWAIASGSKHSSALVARNYRLNVLRHRRKRAAICLIVLGFVRSSVHQPFATDAL
jgi:hypothetical protein